MQASAVCPRTRRFCDEFSFLVRGQVEYFTRVTLVHFITHINCFKNIMRESFRKLDSCGSHTKLLKGFLKLLGVVPDIANMVLKQFVLSL